MSTIFVSNRTRCARAVARGAACSILALIALAGCSDGGDGTAVGDDSAAQAMSIGSIRDSDDVVGEHVVVEGAVAAVLSPTVVVVGEPGDEGFADEAGIVVYAKSNPLPRVRVEDVVKVKGELRPFQEIEDRLPDEVLGVQTVFDFYADEPVLVASSVMLVGPAE